MSAEPHLLPTSAGNGTGRAAPAVLEVDDLTVRFPVARSSARRRQGWLTAVDTVSFRLNPGEALGIVGESGCGKSTLARTIAGLATASSGSIRLGESTLAGQRGRDVTRRIQMVFQDPWSSLNPRMSVGAMLAEILSVHRLAPRSRLRSQVQDLIARVELPADILDRKPRNLSGGQRQRVGIARAIAPQPDVLILDEAIASLDVSVQASVLQLLRGLRDDLGMSMIFISHDLGAVRGLCSRVAVMYLGRIVEVGPVAQVLNRPTHPYTAALIAAEPDLDRIRAPGSAGLQGEPPSPIDRPAGCAFRPRCPIARPACTDAVPPIDTSRPHDQACFFPLADSDVDPVARAARREGA